MWSTPRWGQCDPNNDCPIDHQWVIFGDNHYHQWVFFGNDHHRFSGGIRAARQTGDFAETTR